MTENTDKKLIPHPANIPESIVTLVTFVTFVTDVTECYPKSQKVTDQKNKLNQYLSYIIEMVPRAREYLRTRSTNRAIVPLRDIKNIIKNDNLLNDEEKRKLTELVTVVTPCCASVTQSVTQLLQPRYIGESLFDRVAQYIENTYGFFTTQQAYSDLGLSNAEEKTACRVYLSRLVSKKIIERGEKNGTYRKVDSKTDEIDFKNAPQGSINLFIPFGIHQLVRIMPGNIIVVAGETNSGKTAFMLNTAIANMRDFKVHYFSSEMGASEMRTRLEKFDIPIGTICFRAYERSHDFHDVIRPGEGNINIIDYLEIHDEFWKIGAEMRKIHDRLDGALAFVALQKKRGEHYGRGSDMSAEKARLYITMSPGVCKIVKAKNFRDPERNPNGLQCEFKLAGGHFFKITREWYRPNK